ncbi:aspartyl-phosphate phosphatase Spo0E family protein [Rossellomorea aquimaris]|uniref:aspartyl-phosphate phosphatase Spo0E family protein n=1 Tax=Rossellomorea aquimaris TaxID=189382 RepID=UPI0009ECCC4C|nr:aspartyl-phosphate phosphatase Spo0E family protein [Rossellomorea aquimaris]
MNSSIEVQSTRQAMEAKRVELQHFALTYGYAHPTTLRLSQELDELFNLFCELSEINK